MSNIKPKDFQQATANRIYELMHGGQRRVLLADEVGLGKTIVAREVIRLVKEWHRKDGDDFFKVVYICSNANIANQNIKKLGIDRKMSFSESRLSMQHLQIEKIRKELEDSGLYGAGKMPEQIIPLTPSTSFRVSATTGTKEERALIFVVLRGLPEFEHLQSKLSKYLQTGYVKDDSWEWVVNRYEGEVEKCGDNYLKDIRNKFREVYGKEAFIELVSDVDDGNIENRYQTIGRIRQTFAQISIDMLDPDLVIMDEFQRFSSLLDEHEDDEQSMLTHRFFDPERENTKILLLSATPYKPYSTLEELNTTGRDDHFDDFMRVVTFLSVKKDDDGRFKLVWNDFNRALTGTESFDQVIEKKQTAEDALYNLMARTERPNTGIIEDQVKELDVTEDDIISFAQGQRLLDAIGRQELNSSFRNLPVEYIKSSPYICSFMEGYELKKYIKKYVDCDGLPVRDRLYLNAGHINNYRPIPTGNAKLKYLYDEVFGGESKNVIPRLLWMPASRPYYRAGGLFETEAARRFSKILIFSSWEMVPRMISVMMSYYAEAMTLGEIKNRKIDDSVRYTPRNGRRYGENRMTKYSEILSYPCEALTKCYDPEDFIDAELREVQREVKGRINSLISENQTLAGLPHTARAKAETIISMMKILDGEQIEINEIPENAIEVLTNIAIASPAVCAFRRSWNSEDASQVGQVFESVFNGAEAAAIIDLIYSRRKDDDYYESVLDYCVKGNLQAVIDEYIHVNGMPLIGEALASSNLRDASYDIDVYDKKADHNISQRKMRANFAVQFVNKTVTDKTMRRITNVRNAFNSPLRPFILSSTSVGQEGLDFHLYARKILHWNLPSNPVDLEQREGRVNRHECLAVRRNVAALYGEGTIDWSEMFKRAEDALRGNRSEMVPHWCLPIQDIPEEKKPKLQKIERLVPLYPLSRDVARYHRLIAVLSLYRMTLGHPRQEELLSMLASKGFDDDQLSSLALDLCPFNKRHGSEER